MSNSNNISISSYKEHSIFGNAKRFMLAEKVSFGDKYFRIEDDFSVNAKSWFMMPFSFVLEEMRV